MKACHSVAYHSRRRFLRLSVAAASLPLAFACAPAPAAPAPAAPAKPTEAPPSKPVEQKPFVPVAAPTQVPATPSASAKARGADGTLRMLLWQAPTIVNTHLAQGTKDSIAARCCLEPLITIDGEGKIFPILASEVPTRDNGGLSPDGKSVTYKLKKDVKWADGQPFTGDDVVFTYQYIINPDTTAVSLASYLPIDKVDAPDPLTVKITFKEPAPGWYVPFSGSNGVVLPRHVLKDAIGANARNAPFNLKSFGTGPFMVEDFKPGDLVIYKANPNYRDPGKPAFDRIEMKGGGDAVSAARTVFQTGEFDFAWNLLVEAQVLEQVMAGGKGELITAPGASCEQLFINFADPNQEVDGEKSSPKSKHPFLTDAKVREALSLSIDRAAIAKQLFGPTGDVTTNVLTTPTSLQSKNTKWEFNLDKAIKLLDEAGYKRGGDGIRSTPHGVRMKMVLATSINSLRQKIQALLKDSWQKIGIETELKAVDAGVFFSSSPANPDTAAKFNADIQLFATSFGSPFPSGYMKRWYAGDLARDWAQKSNNWAGSNYSKWTDPEYNRIYDAVHTELDENKNREMWKQLNDIVVNQFVNVPLIDRKFASGAAKTLKGVSMSPFDTETWQIADWRRG